MSFTAYLAFDRAHALADGNALPDRAEGTVLFADISGFTLLTDTLARELGQRHGAEELTRCLNTVYDALISVIKTYHGSVVSFSGDAVTCWFDQAHASAGVHNETAAWAVACSFALQRAIEQVADIRTPGGHTVRLALKVAVASGTVRRFLVGAPAYQQLDVLAGATMLRLAAVEHQAQAGDVVADEHTVALLDTAVAVRTWREHEGVRAAVIAGAADTAGTLAHASLSRQLPALSFEQARPMLLPAVAERLERGAGNMPTELRPVVALFLRFATLAYDADPAAASKLDRYIRWTQDSVSRYGGVLLDVSIGDKGSYLYAAFGAPIAHENDPERAFRAALELVTPPPELAWAGKPQIGITRGTMRTGAYGGSGRFTYGVLGDAVNVAARLMQAAAPGEILVRDAAEVAQADLFIWEALPPLRVKGKPQPIAGFRLLGAHEQSMPSFFQGELVGREAELAKLVTAMQPLLTNQFAGLAVVQGEAGVGKSRLVFELRQRLQQSARITWAYCPSGEILRGSLRPFVSWLRAYFDQSAERSETENHARFETTLDVLIAEMSVQRREDTTTRRHGENQQRTTNNEQRTTDTDQLAAELARTCSFLAALLGFRSEGSLYEQLEPKLRFENTLLALIALIRVESMRGPLVVELEDAHWLDDDSHTLLTNLSRALAGYPVAILCAARPDDEGRPFALPLAEHTPICTVELDTLTLEDTRTLAAQVLHNPVDDELAQFVYERTSGNPFFAEQLLLDLRERGLIDDRRQTTDDGRAIAVLRSSVVDSLSSLDEVPDTLNSLLVARLDRLEEPVREVVQTAAVLGREWAMPILAVIRSGDDLPPKVRAAEEGRVWSPLTERDYLFRHVLLRDAAYGMQLQSQRRELHLQALHAIETEYAESLAPHYVALAYHAREAQDRERERHYAILAGDAAAARYANAEAIGYFNSTLALAEDPAEQAATRLKIGEVLELIGDWDEAALQYQAALADTKDDVATLAQAQFALGKLWRRRGIYEVALNWLNQAQVGWQYIGNKSGVAGVLIQIGIIAFQKGDYVVARQTLEQGLALAREMQQMHAVTQALNVLAHLTDNQNNYDAALILHQESLAIARDMGFKRGIAGSLNNLGNAAELRGDYALAYTLFEEAMALFQEIGDKESIASVLNNLGNLAYYRNDYPAAQKLYEECLALAQELGHQWGIAKELTHIARVVLCQNDYAKAWELQQESLLLQRKTGNNDGAAKSLHVLGIIATQQGNHSLAQVQFEESLQLNTRTGDKGSIVEILIGLASLLLRRGSTTRAVTSIAAAETARIAIELILEPLEQRVYQETIDSAREKLGQEPFEAAWAEGQLMTIEEAVELALAKEPEAA